MAKHPGMTETERKATEAEARVAETSRAEPLPEPAPGSNLSTIAEVGDGEVTRLVEGKRQRRAFMMKHFLPDSDWINKNVVSGGKGMRATIGRVHGLCTGWLAKENIMPDGRTSPSIALEGIFEAESYLSGEIASYSAAYLPMAYAEKVSAVFKLNKQTQVVQLDCDIGLEATGKPIPYEWIVTAFLEGKEMAILHKMRDSRGKPPALLIKPDGTQALLTGPAKTG